MGREKRCGARAGGVVVSQEDDGSMGWWLRFADQIEQIDSRADRETHANRVRLAIGHHTDRLVAWNVKISDWLDISITQAPEREDDRDIGEGP